MKVRISSTGRSEVTTASPARFRPRLKLKFRKAAEIRIKLSFKIPPSFKWAGWALFSLEVDIIWFAVSMDLMRQLALPECDALLLKLVITSSNAPRQFSSSNWFNDAGQIRNKKRVYAEKSSRQLQHLEYSERECGDQGIRSSKF